MKKFWIFFIASIFIFIANFSAQQKTSKDHKYSNVKCSFCHSCKFPTRQTPCVKACPREEIMRAYKYTNEGPVVIEINSLENLGQQDSLQPVYQPVIFPHKLHAEMSKISGGCVQCHHYNTSNIIQPCSNCHAKNRKRANVSRPDLEGAYHQQCITCHRQWSHKTECNSCHKPKQINHKNVQISPKPISIYIKSHVQLKPPVKIVFRTFTTEGKIVTFYHKEHIDRFGLKCADCHKNEVCISCHDVEKIKKIKNGQLNKTAKGFNSVAQAHQRCESCHKTEIQNNCTFCHSNTERQRFNHAKVTGWALNSFHKKLKCQVCHGNKKQFTRLNNHCASCHSNWSPGNFNHSITGIVLDSNHKGLDCEDCHTNRNYPAPPACNNCHDHKSYPKDIPGRLIKIK